MSRRARTPFTKLVVRRLEDRTVPSTVQGTVFNDANNNQMFDPGESGLAGWTVFVDNNQDGILNPGEASAVTGVNGDYLIDTTSITPHSSGWNFFALDLQVGSGGRWLSPSLPLQSADPVIEPNALRDFGAYFEPNASVQPNGPESLVNVATADLQSNVAADSDAAGNTVMAWKSTSGGIDTLFARVFNAGGSPRTGEITVTSAAGLGVPRISMADNGQFAVAWSGNVAAFGKYSAYMRVYSSTGAPITGPTTVIAATSSLSNWVTGVAMDADGDFAVLVSSGASLRVQRYTPAGATNGKLIQVDSNQTFLSGGGSSIAMDDSGRFVVVWHDAPASGAGVFAQRFSANGQTLGALIDVDGVTETGLLSAVSMNSAGQFAVTWWNSQWYQNRIAVYDATGVIMVPATTFAESVTAANQRVTPAALDDAGNATLVWRDRGPGPSFWGNYVDVHFRRLLAGGTLEPESMVNTTTQGRQGGPTTTVGPAVAVTGTNQFVAAWEGYGPGDDAGIFMQRFTNGPPPPPPSTFLSIDDVSIVEANSGTSMVNFTVTLSAASSDTVSVQFLTANDTAQSGSDYLSTGGTVSFAPGETSKVVSVSILGDRLSEANENLFVNLSNPVNAGITDGQGSSTIVDDEPRITITDVAMSEGNSGTKSFVFTVTLSAAYDQPVTMSYATANGTTSTNGANADYVAQNGTLSFAAGETGKTITIAVKGDTKTESDETFFVNLTGNSSNSVFADSQGLGTILNDD